MEPQPTNLFDPLEVCELNSVLLYLRRLTTSDVEFLDRVNVWNLDSVLLGEPEVSVRKFLTGVDLEELNRKWANV